MNNKPICITIGDIDGIGIELLIRLWKLNKVKNFILFTNKKIFINYLKKNKIKIDFNLYSIDLNKLEKNKFYIYDYKVKNKIDNSIKSIKYCYQFTKKKYFKGIITLPVNKNKINTY